MYIFADSELLHDDKKKQLLRKTVDQRLFLLLFSSNLGKYCLQVFFNPIYLVDCVAGQSWLSSAKRELS